MDAETNEKCELRRNIWAVVTFHCIRGKTLTNTFEKMKSFYSDDFLSQMQVFILHKEFSEGRETADLYSSIHSRQPLALSTKINVNTVRTFIEDHSIICQEMAAIMDCSKSTIENIMKRLGMWCVTPTWVLHHLTKHRLQHCIDICTCLKNKYWDDSSFSPASSYIMKCVPIIAILEWSKRVQPGGVRDCSLKEDPSG